MITSEQLFEAHDAGLIQDGEWWAESFDYPGYLVGAHGAVLSFRGPTPHLLQPIRRGEYDGFTLPHRDGGPSRPVYRHRLIAETFHGPCPPGMECCHRDGDKSNCSEANLRWATHVENEADKVLHGTILVGERNPMSKLTVEAVAAMRRIRARTGLPYRAIAEQFGISTMTAYRAIVGQSWKELAGDE